MGIKVLYLSINRQFGMEDAGLIRTSHSCDYSFLCGTGQIEMHKAAGGKNIKYWQVAMDPKFNYPKNQTEFKYDISFLASIHPPQLFPENPIRITIAQLLRNNFGDRAGLFGDGFPPHLKISGVPTTAGNDIYNNSVCTLAISNNNNIANYFSDRLLHALSTGRPCLCWNYPEYENYFANGSEIIIVKSIPEIIEWVNYFKANPEYASEIGRNGAMRVKAEHTFSSRVMELLDITGLKGKL